MGILRSLINFFHNQVQTHNHIITEPDFTTYHIIEDKLPAGALLGEHEQPITESAPYGNIPIALAAGICLRFHLIPHGEIITGIRLRFGTYCRRNDCHIILRLNDYTHHINASELIDNEYVNITLPHSQTSTPKQPINIAIYSTDATADNMIAIWCSKIPPTFINTITLQPITLPTTLTPQVSIIIPIFNKALYTYNCLMTVVNCDPEISKEVIIVDNASTDETMDLLEQLQGEFKVICNIENQGFVQACQQGVEHARGEFILFLNNDTQVTPNWLTNMVQVMDSQPEVGITGSKLIYPHGRLQEAGGIIFNDASGWNYGRLQDPTEPRFNQSREVDYCSGASLMIRKTLWEQVGGFDNRYIPAYYEDTDLCFAVRQAGYKVWYCHDSEVIHHEGITSGTDIQTGYKAYQAINQKKFQAKWWTVLATHLPPPPQTSPEVAAFRWVADKPPSFQIPNHKILATHLLGQGWAANFWSYLNLSLIDEELKLIKSLCFNTVIILVPWVGFQTQVNPIAYYENYFTLLKQLLDKIQSYHLTVILRLGYSHDNGPSSEPEGFLRQIVVGADPVMLKAWCDYLDRLWAIVQSYPNVLGGFISWEDFFLMDLTHIPLESRLLFAERTGYQNYLKQHYTLETIANHYKHFFANYTEIPIPAFKSGGIQLFCAFWDDLLINTIFKMSQQHFPRLTMEVRIDCDPQEESYICHESTFDITSDTHVTMIYYTPAWGAANDNQSESAETIVKRMPFLFERVRAQTTNKVIFIDQFNFIDNTPGFEQNTRILPMHISQFLSQAIPILQQHTIGYGLWALRDVRANALKNGLFEHNYPSWELNQGDIVFDAVLQKKAVFLKPNGTLQQSLNSCFGVPLVTNQPFQLDFQAKQTAAFAGRESSTIIISTHDDNQVRYEHQITVQSKDWQPIHLEEIPFQIGAELRLENKGSSLLLTDFYLYQQCQENGIIDVYGNPKPFYQDLVLLNRQLSTQKQTIPKLFFHAEEITPQLFNGVFADRWMGKTLTGLIAKPAEWNQKAFLIKAYVPKTWHNYHNQLTLTLAEQHYRADQVVKIGYNEIIITLSEQPELVEDILFLQLAADQVFSPEQYDVDSQDNRKVSMLLMEFGFIELNKN